MQKVIGQMHSKWPLLPTRWICFVQKSEDESLKSWVHKKVCEREMKSERMRGGEAVNETFIVCLQSDTKIITGPSIVYEWDITRAHTSKFSTCQDSVSEDEKDHKPSLAKVSVKSLKSYVRW